MAVDFQKTVHVSLFQALSTGLTENVWDHVPYQPPGDPDDGFPYVVVGEQDLEEWDTDDTVGVQISADVHTFSRALGRKEMREVMDKVYGVLHRATLTATGYNFIDCLFVGADTFQAEDGKTHRGVQTFLVTIQEDT